MSKNQTPEIEAIKAKAEMNALEKLVEMYRNEEPEQMVRRVCLYITLEAYDRAMEEVRRLRERVAELEQKENSHD